MSTLVRVPVLSEQITLTDPRVSTVFKDLHRILFFRIMFAVIVSDAVSAIGSPSGMKAIATETQSTIRRGTSIQLGCSFRRYAALRDISLKRSLSEPAAITHQTTITMIIITNIIEQMTSTKLRISLSKGVRPVLGALVIFAIFPKTVESPVETTIPMPLPEMQ